MLKKMDESAVNVIGFQVIGVLEKADFATLTEEVQTAIDEAGSARLLLDFQMYVSEKVSGWATDLKFASKYHGKIEKLALDPCEARREIQPFEGIGLGLELGAVELGIARIDHDALGRSLGLVLGGEDLVVLVEVVERGAAQAESSVEPGSTEPHLE